jgi:DNA-binding GntR family transcriptional regulator
MAASTLQDEVHRNLRGMIISGTLSPGRRLGETHLATELKVSRTPVREAIRLLSEEGFIECLPHCGARVIVPSAQLATEIFLIREALEGIAAREAAKAIKTDRLAFLRAHFESLRPRIHGGDVSDVGDLIHEETFRTIGNQTLERLMSTCRLKISWFQNIASQVPGRLTLAFREHDGILSALEAHDPEWAESAARAHVRHTLDDLLLALQKKEKSHEHKKPKPELQPAQPPAQILS